LTAAHVQNAFVPSLAGAESLEFLHRAFGEPEPAAHPPIDTIQFAMSAHTPHRAVDTPQARRADPFLFLDMDTLLVVLRKLNSEDLRELRSVSRQSLATLRHNAASLVVLPPMLAASAAELAAIFAHRVHLRHLDLQHVRTPEGAAFLARIADAVAQQITSLNVLGLPLDGVDLSRFSALRTLMFGAATTGGQPFSTPAAAQTFFRRLPNSLVELSLEEMSVDGLDLSHFVSLRSLNLNNSYLRDAAEVRTFLNRIPDAIAGRIVELNLGGLSLDGVDLSRFSALRELHLGNARFSDAKSLQAVLNTVTSGVESLSLSELLDTTYEESLPIDKLNLERFAALRTLNLRRATFAEKALVGGLLTSIPRNTAARMTSLILTNWALDDFDKSAFPQAQLIFS
jgi:hypothetical protein